MKFKGVMNCLNVNIMPVLLLFTALVFSACETDTGGATGSAEENPTYSVFYDGNGNSIGIGYGYAPVDNNNYEEGDTVTVFGNQFGMSKAGYDFIGWNTTADGSGTNRLAQSTFMMGDEDVTLYAQWTIKLTFTVTYDGNGNTGGSVPVDTNKYVSGSQITILKDYGNLAGEVFKDGIRQRLAGWSLSKGGALVGSSIIMGSENIVLYAKYTTDDTVLRKIGPAGGLIFYDKGSFDNLPAGSGKNWRYMEAAPVDQKISGSYGPGIQWCDYNNGNFTATGAIQTGVGYGQANTTTIVSFLGQASNYAAKLCDDLSLGGYSDWFLPSNGELLEMCWNLRGVKYVSIYQTDINPDVPAGGIGRFSTDRGYWSSSEYNARQAWVMDFYDGLLSYGWGSKENQAPTVRAARIF